MDFHKLGRKDLQALCKKNQIRANLSHTAMADALQALPTVQSLDELHNLYSPTQVKAEAAGTHAYPTRSHSTRKRSKRMKTTQEEEEHQDVVEVVSSAEVSGEQFHYTPKTGGLVDLSTSDLVLCDKNLITMEETMQSEPVTTNELNLDPTSDKVSGAATFKLQPCSRGTESEKTEDKEFELQSPEIRAEVNEQIEELQRSVEGTSETTDMDTDRLVLPSELLIECSGELSSGQREEVPSVDTEIFEERTPSAPVTRSSHLIELNLDPTPDKETAAAIFKLQHCSQGAKSVKTKVEEFKLQSPEFRTGLDEPSVKLSEMVDEQSMQNAVGGRSEAMDLDTDRSVSLSEIIIEGTVEPSIKQISREEVITVNAEFFEEARQSDPVTTTSSPLIELKTDVTSDKGSSAIVKLRHCNQGVVNQKIECEESKLHFPESLTVYDEPKEKLSKMEQEQGMQSAVGVRSDAMDLNTDRPVLPSEILIEGSGDFHTLYRKDLQALCKKNHIRANMTTTAMADALQDLPTVQGLDEFHNVHSPTQVKAEASGPHVYSTRSQSTRKQHKRMKTTQEEGEHTGVDEVVSSAEVSGEQFHHPLETGGLVDLSTSVLVLCAKNLTTMKETAQSEPGTKIELNLDPTPDKVSGAATFILQHCSRGTESVKTEDTELKLPSPEISNGGNEKREELQSAVGVTSEATDMDTDRPVPPSELLIEGSDELSSEQREEVPSADAEIFMEERTPSELVTRSSHGNELKLNPTPDKGSPAAIFRLQHCSWAMESMKTGEEEFKLQSPEIRTECDEPTEKPSELVGEQSMQNAVGGRSEAMDLDTDLPVPLSEIMFEGTDESSIKHISREKVIPVDTDFFEGETRQLEPVTASTNHLIELKTDPTLHEGITAILKLHHCNQGAENPKIECEESDLQSSEIRIGLDEPKEKLSEMDQDQGMQSVVGGSSVAMNLDTDRPILPSKILIEGSGEPLIEQLSGEVVVPIDTEFSNEILVKIPDCINQIPLPPETEAPTQIPDTGGQQLEIPDYDETSEPSVSLVNSENVVVPASNSSPTRDDTLATNHQTSTKSESVECSSDFINIPSFSSGVKNTNARAEILIYCDPSEKFLLEHSEVQDDTVLGDETMVQSKNRKIGDETLVQSKDRKTREELKGENQRSGDDSMEKLHSLSLRKLKLLYKESREAKGENQRSGDDSTEKLHSLSLRKLKLLYKESKEAKGPIKKERGCGGQESRAESKEDGVKKTDLDDLSLRKLKQKLKEKLTKHDQS